MNHILHTFRCKPIPSRRSICRDLERRGTKFSYEIHNGRRAGNSLLEAIMSSAESLQLSKQCTDFLIRITCLGLEHPCNPDTNLPVLICEENCRIYQQIQAAEICRTIDDQLQRLSAVDPNEILINGYFNFDCTDPYTYFLTNITEADPDNCTYLFSTEAEGETYLIHDKGLAEQRDESNS